MLPSYDPAGPTVPDPPPLGSPTSPAPPATGARRAWWFPLAVHAVVVAASVAVAWLSLEHLPLWPGWTTPPTFPDRPWLEAWTRWDAGWYRLIAADGYPWYTPGEQSPVAFFPAYPLVVGAVARLAGVSELGAGIVVTLACGFASALLFHRWCLRHLPAGSAAAALAVLLLYPYSYYLVGAVYSDALFLAATLGAFLLAEDDRPWLAGLAGAVATAARPVGGAVVIGLVVLVCARRGVLRPGPLARLPALLDPRRLRGRDLGVLVSVLGLAAYCTFLWVRFDAPFAFLEQTGATGWEQSPGPATWFKVNFVRVLAEGQSALNYARFLSQAAFTVVALALVPAVVRRFGWAYGAYVLVIVAVPALSSKDFTGMGRYLLAAFPVFAAAGDLLAGARRAWLGPVVLIGSAGALVVFTSAFARGFYLS